MRRLIIVALGFACLGAIDAAAFDGAYRKAAWQWAQYQGLEVREGVRRLMAKTFAG